MGICCGLLAIWGGLKRDCAIGSARAVSMLCGQLPHDFTIGSACAVSMQSGRLPHDRAIGSAYAVSVPSGRLPHERATGRFRAAYSPAGLHEQAAHARQKFIIGSILLFTSAQITHIIIIWSAVHFNGYGGSLHEKYPAR